MRGSLLVLLAYGIAFGAAGLGTSLLVFDDHPGQLYRVWHVIENGAAPWAWNAGWWTGYPELQFYPPGFAYAAALVHLLSLRALDVSGAYMLMVWVTWLAPGVTAYVTLARVLGDGWRALPGAFIVLTLTAETASGVEGGIHIGMVAARLAWALLPLLFLALTRWLTQREATPWAATPILAAIAVTHPAHLPPAAALVAVSAAVPGFSARRLRAAVLVLALGAALTAFWTLPLLARLGETRALAWGALPPLSLFVRPLPLALAVLALIAFRVPGPRARALAWWPWACALVVLGDAALLEPVGVRWLPADRVIDGAWLAFVLAAGVGIGDLLGRFTRTFTVSTAALLTVGALALLSLPGSTAMLWPARGAWPSYTETVRGLRLTNLWTTLASVPAGRVLFLRSGVPLVYGTEWWRPHTHITSLTPLRAGREIVNGTFTHPSPVAAFLYRGDAGPGAITRLVERLDGESLFGRALEALDAETLDAYAGRLAVSAVVALEDDRPRVRALEESKRFARAPAPAPFLLYVATAGVDVPTRVGRGVWRVALEGTADTWVSARLAYYPLWRAESGGRPLAIRRGELGQLEVRVPAARAVVDLRYGAGIPELAGTVIAFAALAVTVGLLVSGRQRLTPVPSCA
ncbi:MAG TPA: hypothetical protein VGL09_02605 [Methylomirabilota bacterium]